MVKNNDLRYTINDGQEFGSILQAQLMLAIGKNAESFEYKDVTYEVEKEGEDLYLISSNGTVLAIAAKDIVNAVSYTHLTTENLRNISGSRTEQCRNGNWDIGKCRDICCD